MRDSSVSCHEGRRKEDVSGLRVSGSRRRCRRMVGDGSSWRTEGPRRPLEHSLAARHPHGRQAANPPHRGQPLSTANFPSFLFLLLPPTACQVCLPAAHHCKSLRNLGKAAPQSSTICFSAVKLRFCLTPFRASQGLSGSTGRLRASRGMCSGIRLGGDLRHLASGEDLSLATKMRRGKLEWGQMEWG